MVASYVVPAGLYPYVDHEWQRLIIERQHPEGVLYELRCDRCEQRFEGPWPTVKFNSRWTLCVPCWNTCLAFRTLGKRFKKRMRGKKR